MKDEQQFQDMMENLTTPTAGTTNLSQEFRLTLLNTRKSAWLGIALLTLPFLFLTGVIFSHYLGIEFSLLTGVYHWISEMDQRLGDGSFLNWIIRILLTIGPLAAVVVNLLAICHVRYEKASREILLAIKLKWANVAIILGCSMILLVFFVYLIVD